MIGDPAAAILLIKKMGKPLRDKAGCCLHIVLDDFNLEDQFVSWCAGFAEEKQHHDCERLADLLFDMTEEEREEVIGYWCRT